MKKTTLYLILAIAVVVLTVGAFSSLDKMGANITDSILGDSNTTTTAPPTTTATPSICKHTTHTTGGYCSSCLVYVGHDYTERGSCIQNGEGQKHIVHYICSCGKTRSDIEQCTLLNDECVYCGSDYGCKHVSHTNYDSEAICDACGSKVSHDDFVEYISQGDGTHNASYGCKNETCTYGGVNTENCTYVNGVCRDCGHEK